MAKKFMQDAVPSSRKGIFSSKAKAAGKSTAEFAKEKASAPGKLGKEARLAQTFAKFRPKVGMKDGGMCNYAKGGMVRGSGAATKGCGYSGEC